MNLPLWLRNLFAWKPTWHELDAICPGPMATRGRLEVHRIPSFSAELGIRVPIVRFAVYVTGDTRAEPVLVFLDGRWKRLGPWIYDLCEWVLAARDAASAAEAARLGTLESYK